ncbi:MULTISPECIES: type II toxin-antitoxin system Phd/YefM family antitoxin [Symbiopectobacterium]|uniref:type II toxin-antitoxin system Phd/YefM family antitoxin n=1 Tax=Symbiopectobacterium TaxID=801 RepID=UPI002079FA34|nr:MULTISPECIES: type II toxin-antitoxin system Phd/YefM family antitoxin [Symbiopectobacterium]
MKTVTDAEFRENLGDMLNHLRSGGNITITDKDQKNVVLSGSDISPEYLDISNKLKEHYEKVKK